MNDEDFVRQWASDYQPAKEQVATASTPAPWVQVGSTEGLIEEYKRKLAALEEDITNTSEANKARNDKLKEELHQERKARQQTEALSRAEIEKLKRELEAVKEGGLTSNDALRRKNYTAEPAKPREAAVSLADIEKLEKQEKGKEKEKKEKGKEKEKEHAQEKDKEDRERQDKEKQHREKQDREKQERERDDKERQQREKQDREKHESVSQQKVAALETKQRELYEQVLQINPSRITLTHCLHPFYKHPSKSPCTAN